MSPGSEANPAPDPKQFRRAWEIVATALDAPSADRPGIVAASCGADADLRREVESLLAHSTEAEHAAEPTLTVDAVPDRIADYAIVRKIGEGGMGVVYEALQDTPNRRVALKLIRPGQLSPESRRRFDYEVEVLANLQHPGVAHVYGAGTFDLGHGPQSYFAMEYVDGGPLDDFVAQRRCTRDQRLRLLAAVCDAVHHAHQKGVIHRDLKPENILVTSEGDPKVVDFGVARATEHTAADRPTETEAGGVVGTLAYMSPEQVQGRRDQMTASCDVWSLGVIAYELLTGCLPFDVSRDNLAGAAVCIVEQEPIALGRRDRSLAGDLEVLVTTALAKEPARRYASAAELAADLRRFLASRPIVARAPSALYHLQKFARRNRALSVTGIALLLTIAATFFWTLDQNRVLDRSNSGLRRLADGHLLRELGDRYPHLPAAQDRDAEVLRAWYDKAAAVVARRDLHEHTLTALRDRALPYTEADRDRDRRAHPDWAEAQRTAYMLSHRRSGLGPESSAADRREVADLERRMDQLDRSLDARRSWRFEDSADQWTHDTLVALLDHLEEFTEPAFGPFTKVEQWLEIVPDLTQRTIEARRARWEDAIADIADVVASPRYAGLQVTPQLGLVPIGRDPVTQLWEFGHPQTGVIPTRGPSGALELTDDMSLVFVLLPAGTFAMGALRPDVHNPLGAPNVDSGATAEEAPVLDVTLAPFFMSKFEMTKAQWTHFTGRRSGQHFTPTLEGDSFGPRDPVETVHWVLCDEVTRALGLSIPTEAQWEYAARAGSTAARIVGDDVEDLRGFGNFFDRAYMQALPIPASDNPLAWSFDDDAVHVTAVGRFKPNAFGLHDIFGNVREWCRDAPALYDNPRNPGDGLIRGGFVDFRMLRGGAFDTDPSGLRVARRWRTTKWANVGNIGLRPSRALHVD